MSTRGSTARSHGVGPTLPRTVFRTGFGPFRFWFEMTLTEFAQQAYRINRAGTLPLCVDADHGYGNAMSVKRTVEELETAGVLALTIEDTLLPQAYGVAEPQLISLQEGVGKMKAALDGRGDPALVIMGRTGTRGGGAAASSFEECIARAKAYEATGVDALFFTGLTTREQVQAISSATTLPIVLGNTQGELDDAAFLVSQRVKIALQGHTPFAAATQAVYDTLKALRDGVPPRELKGLPSAQLTGRVMRDADVKARASEYLGLNKQ